MQTLKTFDSRAVHVTTSDQLKPISCFTCLTQERIEDFIQRHLFDEFGFADVAFKAAIVDCASDSKVGTVKASLRGRNAHMLVAQVKQKGISDITLNNGSTLRLEICTSVCSLENTSNTLPILGVIIVVTFVSVVLAGAILLMVILIKYRK